VRRFLPDLIDRIWTRRIDPAKVFDLILPLEEAAKGWKAMDERRAIKTPAPAVTTPLRAGGSGSAATETGPATDVAL
jgi:hypothetical protein